MKWAVLVRCCEFLFCVLFFLWIHHTCMIKNKTVFLQFVRLRYFRLVYVLMSKTSSEFRVILSGYVTVDNDADVQLAFLQCRSDDKTAVLLHLLQSVVKPSEQTVVFASTKHHVEFLNLVILVWLLNYFCLLFCVFCLIWMSLDGCLSFCGRNHANVICRFTVAGLLLILCYF